MNTIFTFILLALSLSANASSPKTKCESNLAPNPLVGQVSQELQDFSELVAAIKLDIRKSLKLKRINKNKNIVWDGPDVPKFARAGTPPYPVMLTASNLKYSNDEQGRDAISEILAIYLQLTMEQGIRYSLSSNEVRSAAEAMSKMEALLSTPIITKEEFQKLKSLPEVVSNSIEKLANGQATLIGNGEVDFSTDNSNSNWPKNGRPMPSQLLYERIADTILQAYQVTGTNDVRADLIAVLERNAPLGWKQGRTLLFKYEFGLSVRSISLLTYLVSESFQSTSDERVMIANSKNVDSAKSFLSILNQTFGQVFDR